MGVVGRAARMGHTRRSRGRWQRVTPHAGLAVHAEVHLPPGQTKHSGPQDVLPFLYIKYLDLGILLKVKISSLSWKETPQIW